VSTYDDSRLGSGARGFLSHPISYLAQFGAAFKGFMFLNIIFNVTDLTSTFVAFQTGLTEGNSMVLGFSAALGLSILDSLALVKILFIAGAALVALVGGRSTSTDTRNVMLTCLMASTFVFLFVSVNNVIQIVS
jgi:hypothetical protein